MGLLDGKKVLVTGARKGIGRGIAYKVAQEGADVGVNDYIDDEETQKTVNLVESLGRKCSSHIFDVSKKNNIDSMSKAKEINEKLMPLHKALFIESNPSPVKYAASLLNLSSEEVRLPLVKVTEKTKKEIQKALKFADLL